MVVLLMDGRGKSQEAESEVGGELSSFSLEVFRLALDIHF
jgi:hypothetical protein